MAGSKLKRRLMGVGSFLMLHNALGAPAAEAVCTYLLLAPFDGADDQGYANGQVLDTEAEGVAVGSGTVVETDGTLALVSDKCHFTAQATPVFGDLQLYAEAVEKSLGRALLYTVNISTLPPERGSCHLVGWSDAGPCVAGNNREYFLLLYESGVPQELRFIMAGGAGSEICWVGWAADTDYQIAIVLGGYDASGQPWYNGAVGTFAHGAAVFIKGGVFSDWTVLWRWAGLNTTPLYPAFMNQHCVGDVSYIRVPDHDYSAVLRPTAADWFTDSNGTSLDAHTPDVDPGGGWTERVGNWQITGNEAVIAAQTDRACATMAAGIADVWGRDSLESNTADSTTAGDSALVYRWVDNDNYWYVGINDAANAFRIVERNGGAETVRDTAAVAIGTGTQYEVTFQVSGNDHQAWLNGVNRLTYTSASHNTATICGVRSKETSDAHDNFHVQPADGYTDLDDCPGYAVTP